MGEIDAIDIIREIVNIGIGEAASSLSELVKDRVYINVPDIQIMDFADVPAYIQSEMEALGILISQDFHGLIDGKVLLTYSRECSISLVNSLYGITKDIASLTNTDIATLQEVGNIIIVSCISAISNIIEGRLNFTIPQVTMGVSSGYLQDLVKDLEEFEKCIIIKNQITIRGNDIRGYIFILLTFRAFDLVTEKLGKVVRS
jgi:chemotaxis protein CheC